MTKKERIIRAVLENPVPASMNSRKCMVCHAGTAGEYGHIQFEGKWMFHSFENYPSFECTDEFVQKAIGDNCRKLAKFYPEA